ncbi:MAG: hypothetical protein AAF599_07005 [Bacteroidota bacterium]
MKLQIPIISDTLPSDALLKRLQSHAAPNTIQFKLLKSKEIYRSPLTDPTILAAIVEGSAAIIASLVALIGLAWASLPNKEQTIVQIELKEELLKSIPSKHHQQLKKQFPPDQLHDTQLTLTVPQIESGNYTYILESVPPTYVQTITIVEDI